jgi:hypothetical protein
VSYRAVKFTQRHWRGLVAAAVAALVFVGLVGFYTARLATERDRACRRWQSVAVGDKGSILVPPHGQSVGHW